MESQLRGVLHNHLCAEVAGGAVKSKQDAVEYLTWTFFFRRLVMNPTYYHRESLFLDRFNCTAPQNERTPPT